MPRCYGWYHVQCDHTGDGVLLQAETITEQGNNGQGLSIQGQTRSCFFLFFVLQTLMAHFFEV